MIVRLGARKLSAVEWNQGCRRGDSLGQVKVCLFSVLRVSAGESWAGDEVLKSRDGALLPFEEGR